MSTNENLYTASIVLVDPRSGHLVHQGIHIRRGPDGLWQLVFADNDAAPDVLAPTLEVVDHLFLPMLEFRRRRDAR